MKNFFVMTRGRTGSTAVMDSLNKSNNIIAAQELFINWGLNNKEINNFKNIITPRFDLWLNTKKIYLNIVRIIFLRKYIFKQYIEHVESKVLGVDAKAFGFKVISHHFDERPGLKALLLERGYKAIYLKRNIPRQVISGMVAKLRGKYNAHDRENYNDDASYHIDINEFKSLVEWEAQAVANDIAMLDSSGFAYIQVRYEDFVANSDAFFAEIFGFLDIPEEKLPESSFSIMIKDLRQVVQNYQEVEQCLAKMGMTIE